MSVSFAHIKFSRTDAVSHSVVSHSRARARLEALLVLGLCGVVTVSGRTSSAYGSLETADATSLVSANGRTAASGSADDASGSALNSVGGYAALIVPATANEARSRPSRLPAEASGSRLQADGSNQNTEFGASTVTGKHTELGSMRPVWPTTEVTLTVDVSYLALPYAMTALKGALFAWTSRCSWLPKVEIRVAEEAVADQTTEQNLNDHRIFFSPFGDSRAKGALAVTLVTADESNNTIIDADILVNGGHLFTDVTTLDPAQNTSQLYDLQDVLAHEFGHWFGLDENFESPDATMYAYVFPGERHKRDLTDEDVRASELAHLQARYADSDGGGCKIARTAPNPSKHWFEGFVLLGCLVWFTRNRVRRSFLQPFAATKAMGWAGVRYDASERVARLEP